MKLLRKSFSSGKAQQNLNSKVQHYSSQENYPTLADSSKMKKKNQRETDEVPSATAARPWKDEVTSEPSPPYTFHKSFLYEEILPNVPFNTNPPDETKIPPLSPSNTVQERNDEYWRYCLKKQERKLKKVKIIEHSPPSTKHQAWMETDNTRDSKVKGEGSIIKLRRKKQKKDAEPQQDEIEVAVELMKPPKRQRREKVTIIDDHLPRPSEGKHAWEEKCDVPVVQREGDKQEQKEVNMTTKVRTLPSTKLPASSASVVRPWKDGVTSKSEPYRFNKSFTYEIILPNVPLDTAPCDVPFVRREQEKQEIKETLEDKKIAKVSTPPTTEGQGVRKVDPCILKVVQEPEEPLETMNIFTTTELRGYERRQLMLNKKGKEQERQRRIELGEQVDNPSLKKRLLKKCSKLLNKTVLHQTSAAVPIHPHLSQTQCHLFYI